MRKYLLTSVMISSMLIMGCSDTRSHLRSVYMLLDTSGTYTGELSKAQSIINYLLVTLNSGDSLAVARIDSGSFSEKDIISKVTFDDRPSAANDQKRDFRNRIDNFVQSAKGSSHTDITGGLIQAVEYLNETGAGQKYVFIFSDLEEDLQKEQIRDFDISMDGTKVIALNVTKLRSDNVDPRNYLNRLDRWQKRVVKGGGDWQVINDLDHIDHILK